MIGCGLFAGYKAPYDFQEAPQYYHSEKQEMVDEAKIHRQSQMKRLEADAKILDDEKKHDDEIAAKKAEKT